MPTRSASSWTVSGPVSDCLGLVAFGQVVYNLTETSVTVFRRGSGERLLKQIVVVQLCALARAAAASAQTYGDLQFPEDEHEHPDGWNFWWGAADLMTSRATATRSVPPGTR